MDTRQATAAPPVMSALVEIAALRDPVGILSVYVDGRPGIAGGREQEAGPATRTGIEAAVAQVQPDGGRESLRMLEERLHQLGPTIESILAPSAPGKGRALFATVAGGDIRRVALELPLPNRVVLALRPHVGPLMAALDMGRPAGIVIVSRQDVRVLEWRLGETDDLARFVLEPSTDEWRMMKGPAPSGSWMAQQSASQQDRFTRRLARRRSAQLVGLGGDIHALARNHGWDRLLLVGDERLTVSLAEGLPESGGPGALHVRARPGDWLPPGEIGKELVPFLEEAREQQDLAGVRDACDRALSRGLGAVGLADTLDALDEGRVHRLLLDGQCEWDGIEAPDGHLFPAGVEPPGIPRGALRTEPRLGDRMIERALMSDAVVDVVSGPAAEALQPHDGVAAILRW